VRPSGPGAQASGGLQGPGAAGRPGMAGRPPRVPEDLAPEVLAVLPKDVGASHAARRQVKYKAGRASFEFKRGREKIACQATIQSCGSQYATERVARALWVKLEQGASKDETLRFRKACYDAIRKAREGDEAAGEAETRGTATKREASDAEAEGPASKRPRTSTASERPRTSTGAAPSASPKPSPAKCAPRPSPAKSTPAKSTPGKSPGRYVSFRSGLRGLQDACEGYGVGTGGSWAEIVFGLEAAEEKAAEQKAIQEKAAKAAEEKRRAEADAEAEAEAEAKAEAEAEAEAAAEAQAAAAEAARAEAEAEARAAAEAEEAEAEAAAASQEKPGSPEKPARPLGKNGKPLSLLERLQMRAPATPTGSHRRLSISSMGGSQEG